MGLKPKPERVSIPHESGEWMELRRLTWWEQDRARDAAQKAAAKLSREFGGDVVSAMQNVRVEDTDEAREKRRNSPDAFDTEKVLGYGICGWSYDAEVSEETIRDLDAMTAEWAKFEILELSRERTDAEKKGHSSASSTT